MSGACPKCGFQEWPLKIRGIGPGIARMVDGMGLTLETAAASTVEDLYKRRPKDKPFSVVRIARLIAGARSLLGTPTDHETVLDEWRAEARRAEASTAMVEPVSGAAMWREILGP